MTSKFTLGPWDLCDKGDYGDFDGNSQVILGDDMRLNPLSAGHFFKQQLTAITRMHRNTRRRYS
jgi:hypothetical protein